MRKRREIRVYDTRVPDRQKARCRISSHTQFQKRKSTTCKYNTSRRARVRKNMIRTVSIYTVQRAITVSSSVLKTDLPLFCKLPNALFFVPSVVF